MPAPGRSTRLQRARRLLRNAVVWSQSQVAIVVAHMHVALQKLSTQLHERPNGISFLLLISRQGRVRLAKWYTTMSTRNKNKIIKDVTQLVLARRTRMCNFLEYKDSKVVYRRYASLFFVTGIGHSDNELITLEIIHRYVEVLDRYFGNVCELDLIFNFQKAYSILDELIIAGEMQESSKKSVLRAVGQSDSIEEAETSEDSFARLSSGHARG